MPPLLEAVYSGAPRVLQALLARRADLTSTDPQACHACSLPPVPRPVRLTSDFSQGNTALHVAAQQGDVECTRTLVAAKADPNALNRQRQSPLHEVAVHFFKA